LQSFFLTFTVQGLSTNTEVRPSHSQRGSGCVEPPAWERRPCQPSSDNSNHFWSQMHFTLIVTCCSFF